MTDRERFLHDYDVPRGTALLFDTYAELLIDWQRRMNLVAPSTIHQVWQRHFADSAQLARLAPSGSVQWADMGSGAGFPGIVVALLTEHQVTLIESITKKCHFLQAAIDELGLRNTTVVNRRAETFDQHSFDVVSARAFAPLVTLFEAGSGVARSDARWLLPKGERVEQELEEARLAWDFSAELIPSRTDERGRIVVARSVRRKAPRR